MEVYAINFVGHFSECVKSDRNRPGSNRASENTYDIWLKQRGLLEGYALGWRGLDDITTLI